MSFLCMARNKEVSYHQCINECQYYFKSACIDKMDEAYNQALEDLWNTLVKYQRAIENANYPFNFIQIAFDELREEQLKEKE